MATITDVASGTRMIPLAEIRTDQNVRQELRAEEVEQLVASIALLGQLSPVSVRPLEDGGYVLIAGHKRHAALTKLGLTEIRAEVRPDSEQEAAERAAENIVRSALNPLEAAVAVQAMLDRGLTRDGAAQALGWSRQRVSARVKLLELPEPAQQMIGAGTLPLAAVEPLLAIGKVSPDLLALLTGYLASEDGGYLAGQVAREPGRVLGHALRKCGAKVFAAYLNQLPIYAVEELKLGKKTDALLAEAEALRQKINRYGYAENRVHFTQEDIDQARAAGVLIEFEHSTPIICDRSVYRDLCRQAIKRNVEELRARAEQVVEERREQRTLDRVADPDAELRRERGRKLRVLAEQAHGANLDLGRELIIGLATVEPSDMTVARFFAYAVLGADWDSSPYTQVGGRVAELAASGIRLVIEQFRTDVTKTRKDGSRGALRIDYGKPGDAEQAVDWIWRFVDGARTAGELYGRTLVVIAAQQYASRLVVPQSQQQPAIRWSSHKDHAQKALAKLAGPHLPVSLKQLEKAVAKVHAGQHPKPQTHGVATTEPVEEEMVEIEEVTLEDDAD